MLSNRVKGSIVAKAHATVAEHTDPDDELFQEMVDQEIAEQTAIISQLYSSQLAIYSTIDGEESK